VAELGYKISLSEEAKDFVADEGFDEAFGARPLARALQKLIEDPLAERIIGKQLNEGDEVIIELKDKELTFEIIKAKEEAPEKATEALPESTEDSTKDEA
jgi:ATP-dependent Clp protease ATP-binding subunit ClpC